MSATIGPERGGRSHCCNPLDRVLDAAIYAEFVKTPDYQEWLRNSPAT